MEIREALNISQQMLNTDVYLIPARLKHCQIPENLREFNYVDLFEDDGFTQLLEHIQIGFERKKLTNVTPRKDSVSTTVVEFNVEMGLEQFDAQKKSLLQSELAILIGISSHAIKIDESENNSIKVTIELPVRSAEKLLSAYMSNDPKLMKLFARRSEVRSIAGSQRNKWVNWEICNILVPKFGEGNVDWDFEFYNWVMIKNFQLPHGWSKSIVPLLIEIPPTYPEALPRQIGFYTEKSLRDSKGFTEEHYFDKMSILNKYSDRGWAWLSVHIDRWNPKSDIRKGDNLLTICNLIYYTLSTGA